MGSEREEERERKECRDSLLLHFVCGEGSILFFCFWVPLFSIYDFTGERMEIVKIEDRGDRESE